MSEEERAYGKDKSEEDVKLTLRNNRDREVTFVLEPWGMIWQLHRGDEVVVLLHGPQPIQPEVDLADDEFVVWGWSGCVARVLKNGVESYVGGRVPDGIDLMKKIGLFKIRGAPQEQYDTEGDPP